MDINQIEHSIKINEDLKDILMKKNYKDFRQEYKF